MQERIIEKNKEIEELSGQVKHNKACAENFKYVASLNQEYFEINLGDGKARYTEA